MARPHSTTRIALIQQLRSLQQAGLQQVPRVEWRSVPPGPPHPDEKKAIEQVTKPTESDSASTTTQAASSPKSKSAASGELATLCQQVAQCTRCSELASQRTNTVFGVGNPQARLCFLGEAPGADEDRLGEPFVGRAGQLLDKILEACTLSRDDVYILNILKCRPPGNRNPLPDEVDNCREFFEAQIRLINPEFICCLGAVAATNLLDTKQSIGKLRGRLHDWQGIRVLATYHPAYLLRNPPAKKEVWKDMQFLMREMGIELPKR
ncbi:MAG: uracil-DNA glycosylase [Planctomycetota bacterium]